MAQKVSITLVDDIDGETEAAETVSFGIDGTSYEIDLTEANASALREALAPYVGHARKVGGSARRTRSAVKATAPAGEPTAAQIREWARANGHDVPERGRIPAGIRDAYAAAN